jgi:hypothetical protein
MSTAPRLLPLVALALAACATISPEAATIQLHTEMTTLLNDCQKLGPVAGQAGGLSEKEATRDAWTDLRENAHKQYQADTVVVLNTDVFDFKALAQGIAFRCYTPEQRQLMIEQFKNSRPIERPSPVGP